MSGSQLFAVIMAGGSGTRFWPASRHAHPKQLLAIGGDEALLVQTSRRLGDLVPPERQMVVTGAHLVDAVRAMLPAIPPEQVIGEPVGRDTAACVGLAASLIERIDATATVVAMSADHVMTPEEVFREHMSVAAAALDAHPDRVLVFGIQPTRPETGYGWLRQGDVVGEFNGRSVHELDRFVEKPDAAGAQAMFDAGGHAWNAGLFAFRPGTMLEAYRQHLPQLAAGLATLGEAWGQGDFEQTLGRVFPDLQATSIDKGVMEKLSGTLMLPLPLAWDDVGAWSALERLREPDDRGNVADGELVALEASGHIVSAPAGSLVAIKGVDDLIVVHTPDATLVCRRDDDQGVKAIVEELRARGLTAFL
jgi:mannose-1-phosphate guanylyltransferase